MNNTAKRWLRGLLAGYTLSAVATGCVRMNEPEAFICHTAADCEAGQECKDEVCRPAGWCQVDYDCWDQTGGIVFNGSLDQICVNDRCAPAECTSGDGAACQGFKCYGGRCEHACYGSDSCEAGYHCSGAVCVPGSPIANGGACTSDTECSSLACCPSVGGSVCAKSCSVSGETCTSALDCITGFCCASSFGGNSTCSATACAAPPECATDFDCAADKVCELGLCVPEPVGPGMTCLTNEQCTSNSCAGGKCRGFGGQGDDCMVDTDCEARRLCCISPFDFDQTCGELDLGCPGSTGSACEFESDCINDDCNGSFCTRLCTTNADCGTNSWGVPNACETNALGSKICYPGCTTTQQCIDNLNSFELSCYDALDSNAKICAPD